MKNIVCHIVFLLAIVLMLFSCKGSELDYEFSNPGVNVAPPEKLRIELLLDEVKSTGAEGRLRLSDFNKAKGSLTVTRVGFCYGLEANPTLEDDMFFEDRHHIVLSENGEERDNEFYIYKPETGEVTGRYSFSHEAIEVAWSLENLAFDTKYHCRTFIENAAGIVYGDDNIMQTSDTTSILWNVSTRILEVECSVEQKSMIVPVELKFESPAELSDLSEYGVCYSTEANPSLTDNYLVGKCNVGSTYYVEIKDLNYKTAYHLRPYFISDGEIRYGKEVVMTTLDFEVESNIIDCTLTSSTQVHTQMMLVFTPGFGIENLSEYGICIDNTDEPSIDNSLVIKGVGATDVLPLYSIDISELEIDTLYYIRPYVVREDGRVVYGEISEVSTDSEAVGIKFKTDVEYSCAHAEDIDVTVAMSLEGVSITDLKAYGVCYGSNETPTVEGKTKVGVGASDVSQKYSVNIENLSRGEKVYIRPYIILSDGRVMYGSTIAKSTIYLEVVKSEQILFERAVDKVAGAFIVDGEKITYLAYDGSYRPYPYRFTYQVNTEYENIEDAVEIGWVTEYEVESAVKKSFVTAEEFRDGAHEEAMWHYTTAKVSYVILWAYAKMKDGTIVYGKNSVKTELAEVMYEEPTATTSRRVEMVYACRSH